MKNFEYRLLKLDSSVFKGIDYQKLNDQLNHLGIQGWEVVSTVSLTSAGSTTGLLITLSAKWGGRAGTKKSQPTKGGLTLKNRRQENAYARSVMGT